MPKFPHDNVLVPQAVPDPFGFASSPTSEHLNTIQSNIHQDLRTLYRLYRNMDLEIGTGSTRSAVDASNFSINSQRAMGIEYARRLRDAIAASTTEWTAATAFTNTAKMRVMPVPMKLESDYTPGSSPAWRNNAASFTPTPIYQDSYSGMLLGAMDGVDYLYKSPITTLIMSAIASDGTQLITGTSDVADVFDQSKETHMVLHVDRDIEDEMGKTDEPYEELTVTISTSPSLGTFNALSFEFGLPMDIDDLQFGASPVDATDEVMENLNTVDSTATSKYYNQFHRPYENITRRTIFLSASSHPVTFKLRSSHWIPVNNNGIVKKRFLFPIYNIDAIDYTPTSGDSYGIIKLDIPKEWAVSTTIFPTPPGTQVAFVDDEGIHQFPTFVREGSQSDIRILDTESNAKDINVTAHTLLGAAANELWLRVKLSYSGGSGDYIPRLDAAFVVYQVS